VQQTADGGFIVTASTDSFGAGERDAWILRLDSAGTVIWQKTYGGTGNDEATSVQIVGGGFLVSGYTESFGAGNEDAWLLMLNADGTVAWQKTFGGPDVDEANSVTLTNEGKYLLAGSTASSGQGQGDAWVMLLDAQGSVIGCELMGSSDAIVADTGVIAQDTDALPQISSAMPDVTLAVPLYSTVEKTQQCVAP